MRQHRHTERWYQKIARAAALAGTLFFSPTAVAQETRQSETPWETLVHEQTLPPFPGKIIEEAMLKRIKEKITKPEKDFLERRVGPFLDADTNKLEPGLGHQVMGDGSSLFVSASKNGP